MADSAATAQFGQSSNRKTRRLPIGAEIMGDGLAEFCVWAPAARTLEVVVNGRVGRALTPRENGYFSGTVEAAAGDRYAFRLDSTDRLLPDPASRYQPDGPHAASQVVDPAQFEWTDRQWKGVRIEGQVLYELHVGTFTTEGTWAAATRELAELADLGITVVELMPVAEFDGRFGWGYDGVDLYAPSHLYGLPDELRRFVDRAHQLGVGVILDVVYNHLGPSGNYLREFSPRYFTDKYDNEWGDAINFDGHDAAPVREFFIENAGYWIDEFHMDGLRLDATQQIFDDSGDHVLAAIGRRVRERARGRSTILISENEPQHSRLVRPAAAGGYEHDALWNDDFHHSAIAALTGRAEAYYSDTSGAPQELVSAAKYGYLFQGQHYEWQRHPRGTPGLDLPPAAFVAYLQNHDQVANSARGLRAHQCTSPGKWRAMTALLLLMPATPMLFQGQEFASSNPFLYFADHGPELAAAVVKGRREFLSQFPSVVGFMAERQLDGPADPRTFERSKLDLREREAHAETYRLHRDLLRLRRDSPAFRAQRRGGVDGAVLAPQAFLLRYFAGRPDEERVLLINLGGDLCVKSFAEPLLAPPEGREWTVEWSSESPYYGGGGTRDIRPEGRWALPAASALVLAPVDTPMPTIRRGPRRTA